MEKLSETKIIEYKYKTEDERGQHVEQMESQGFKCSGQVRRSDDSLMSNDREYYWYAKFFKKY